jgi:ribonucleoside-triphosphate reductase
MNTEKLLKEVLKRSTWHVRDNSNIQISPSMIDYYLSSKAKEEYALKKLYSKEVARHHKAGSIYIHTLHNPFKPYCNGIDTRIFLLDGLRFPHCRSNPPKHFSSAVYQSMAFMFYSQLFFSGAQAMDYYNWFLAPYLHYDKLSYKQLKQVLQGFVFQLNQSNRTGAQSAFTNIGMRIKCPSYLKNEPQTVNAIYSGKKLKDTYADFEDEARTIYKAMMEVMTAGDGNNAPFTFPIITTAITKDIDWGDELVDVTMKAASEKGVPYFFNLTTDYLNEKYVHAMCCRLIVEHSGGVWMAGGLGTGSNKVVTINLPHISLKVKSEREFFSLLYKEMIIARKALLESNSIIKKSLDKWNLLPFLKMKTCDKVPYYNFKQRKLTFGVIGMNECLLNLIGEPLTSNDGIKFGLKIIRFMVEEINEFSKEDNVKYTLEQTPAESATHKLAMKDKDKFGRKAHVQGKGKQLYYSNSTHVPYKEDVSLFKKLETEAEFHPYFSGGVISHIWIGESKPTTLSLKNLVSKISRTKMAYFTFSPDYSVCRNEHFSRGKQKLCPKCGARIIDHINRVVGYFTRTSGWNPGKQREYHERKRYILR